MSTSAPDIDEDREPDAEDPAAAELELTTGEVPPDGDDRVHEPTGGIHA